LDHGEEVLSQFIVTGSDAAEMLQLGEEALDEVSLTVKPCAEVRFRRPVGLGRDVGKRPPVAERRADAIGIVCLVCEHDRTGDNVIQQCVGGLPIVTLSGGEAQPDREPLRIDDRVDFCRKPTSGATEAMISIPLFAVAACWWARTDVLSII
jgi:hypothetical protein